MLNSIKFYDLETQAFITFLATLIGILIPILYQINKEEKKDKRILAFTLGLTWNELNFNKYVLDNLAKNTNLEKIVDEVPNLMEFLEMYKIKVDGLLKMSLYMLKSNYEASQNSGAISTYKVDEDFNSVVLAYDDMSALQLMLTTLSHDLNSKILTTSLHNNEITKELAHSLKKDLRNKATILKKELDKADKSVKHAIERLDNSLNKMDIKVEKIFVPAN